MTKKVYAAPGTPEQFVTKACEVMISENKKPLIVLGYGLRSDLNTYGIAVASVEGDLRNVLQLLKMATDETEAQIKRETKNN